MLTICSSLKRYWTRPTMRIREVKSPMLNELKELMHKQKWSFMDDPKRDVIWVSIPVFKTLNEHKCLKNFLCSSYEFKEI